MLPREEVKGELRHALKNWNEPGPRTEREETYRRYWAFFSRKIPDFLRQGAEVYHRDGRDPAEVANELGVKRKTVIDNASHALGMVSDMICTTLAQQESGFANVERHQIVTAICEHCRKPFETVADWDLGNRPQHFFCCPACYEIYRDVGSPET